MHDGEHELAHNEYLLHGSASGGSKDARRRKLLCSGVTILAAGAALLCWSRIPSEGRGITTVSIEPAQACSNGFPQNFVWGLGTAAYQIEGGANSTGRQPSIWDKFSHTPGKVYNGDTGDEACDHIHLYREDVRLMHSMGLEHYRFSISWSRVMSFDQATQTMVPNERGLRFYGSLLTALEEFGIQPYVTLYHWDLPLSLHDKIGGWHTPNNQRIVDEFVKYADLCFERFGARVKFWFTFNEPWSFTVEGYDSGKSAPGCVPFQAARGRCVHGSVTPYIVGHNVLLSHAAAVQRFRTAYQPRFGGTISITLNCDFSIAASSSSQDVAAAERANEFMLGWWLQPLLTGDYPKVMREFVGERLPRFTPEESRLLVGSIDVLAINHYSTSMKTNAGPEAPPDAYAAWAEDQKVSSASRFDCAASSFPPHIPYFSTHPSTGTASLSPTLSHK